MLIHCESAGLFVFVFENLTGLINVLILTSDKTAENHDSSVFLWHILVLKLRGKLELQQPAYVIAMWDQSCVCDLHYSSPQGWILNPLSKAIFLLLIIC